MSAGRACCARRTAGGGTLTALRRVIDADAVAAGPAQQPIDRHVPQLAGDVPQGHVDAGERVDHERPAAHVAMGPVDLLPEIFDARRVLAVEQLEQRFDQRLRHSRIDSLDVAPADDAVIGFDADEDVGLTQLRAGR